MIGYFCVGLGLNAGFWIATYYVKFELQLLMGFSVHALAIGMYHKSDANGAVLL